MGPNQVVPMAFQLVHFGVPHILQLHSHHVGTQHAQKRLH